MAIIYMNCCGDEGQTVTTKLTSTQSVAPTIDLSLKEHGISSFQHNSGAGNSGSLAYIDSMLANAGRRVSAWIYFTNFTTLGGLGSNNLAFYTAASGGFRIRLDVDASGTLRFTDDVPNQYGSASWSGLSTGTWYRICVAWTITSQTVNELRCFVNGVQRLSVSNVTLQTVATNRLGWGWSGLAPGANRIVNIDSVYVDDSTSLTDPGNIRITSKHPNALGANNQFDTQIGSFTNRWDGVNQAVISTAQGWRQAATTQVRESYGIQNASTGDVNISAATLVGYQGWLRANRGTGSGSPTPKIILNGVETAITLGTSALTYVDYATTSTYPSNADVIGMVSTGTAHDTNLYECGVDFAYIASAPPATTTPRMSMMGIGP